MARPLIYQHALPSVACNMTRSDTDLRFRAGLVCIAVLEAVVATPSHGESSAKCRPGDHLIGEDARFIYCSRMTCDELEAQLERDKQALRGEQDNILATNAELQAWTADNQKAQAAALREA